MTKTPTPARLLGTRRVLTGLVTVMATGAALLSVPATASAATVPAAPTNLSVQNPGNSSYVLYWADNSSDETGFEIQRCTNGGILDPNGQFVLTGCTDSTGFALRGQAAADTTSYADPAFGNYTYRVRAVNAVGASAWTASVHQPIGAVPVASIAPIPASSATVPVAFDGSGSSTSGSMTGWEWSFGDGATAAGPTATHAYAASGTYAVMLTVTNALGDTAFVRISVTVGPAPYVPVAPSGLKATSTVKKRVDLTWSNAGTAGAVSFVVYRCTGSSCTRFAEVTRLLNSATSYADTPVRSGTTYRYYVAALYTTGPLASASVTVKAR